MSLTLITALCIAGFQQQTIQPRKTEAAVYQDSRPVTCQEASVVFETARTILGKALKTNLGPNLIPTSSSKAISREQIVAELSSILHSLGPQIKFTPKAQSYSSSLLKMDRSELPQLKRLIRLGYVGKVSPLATSRQDSLTVKQFGETLGIFLNRVAELTHSSSMKWSPILGAGS